LWTPRNAGGVCDDADGDRERDPGGHDRWQDPSFALIALLVRHGRILYFCLTAAIRT
jgi:hypothetical protein